VRGLFINGLAGLAGIALACAAAALFAVLSGFALSDARLVEVIKMAFERDQLAYAARIREDFFTDCALLTMQKLRQGSVLRGALDTRFLMRQDEHPCDTLRTLALGSAEERASLPASFSYFNYPYGSRHLQAFVLSALDFGQATSLYRAVSYGSVVLLFVAMLWRLRTTAILLVPIPLLLIGAFSFHVLGGNLAHAPGYFIGFIALAIFVASPAFFRNSNRRAGVVGAVGVIGAYFDVLDGVIVTLLALTILLNHFFYVAAERDRAGYLIGAVSQAVAIFVCFFLAYVVVTLGRLGMLWVNGVDVSTFLSNLSVRTAQDIGIPITFRMNLETLFALRSQLMPGGAVAANWVFLAGIAGWILAALTGLAVLASRRTLNSSALVDLLVLALVGVGVFVWYWRFAAHTYVHAAFMVRLLALPLACGLTAALLVMYHATRDAVPVAVLVLAFGAALALAMLGLHTRWTAGTAVAARFVEASADLVGCGPLQMAPDGLPDGIIVISFQETIPPLAYLGLKMRRDTFIQLVRRDPLEAYHTGSFRSVLGIAERPGGGLLNRPDGGFSFTAGSPSRVFGHFCRGGHEPRSRYELLVDGVTVPILP
jgi:hypothetical protein